MKMELLKVIKWRYKRLKQLLKIRSLTFNKHSLDLKGVKICLGDHLSDNIKEAILGGYYESAELHMIEAKLTKDDVVMEIGTGIGFISTYCATQIGSKKIYTYEANPALESHIRKNYEINNVSPSLEICLLSDKEGEQAFYVEKDFWSSSMIQRSQSAKEIKIPMRVLNDEILRLNPSFLIIDIEGGEHTIFKFINFHNIKKISIELHTSILGEHKISDIKTSLIASGSKLTRIYQTLYQDLKKNCILKRFNLAIFNRYGSCESKRILSLW